MLIMMMVRMLRRKMVMMVRMVMVARRRKMTLMVKARRKMLVITCWRCPGRLAPAIFLFGDKTENNNASDSDYRRKRSDDIC